MLLDGTFLLLLLVLVLCAHLLHRYLRLRHVPGPVLARVSDLWRWYDMNLPGHGERMVKLHRRYGPLVRLGPNRVSTSDPSAIPIVFTTTSAWEKAPSYQPSTPVSSGKAMPSVVAMTEAQSTAVHRVAGSAFTANALLDYEDFIDQSCAALLTALKERPKPIDLSWWFGLFAMDVINRIAFSDSLGFLKTGEDVESLMVATKDRFDHWGQWSAVPFLEHLFFKSPIRRLWRKAKSSPLALAAQRKLELRAHMSQSAQKDQLDLLGKFLEGTSRHPGLVTSKEIIGMVQSTIGAGADTTASTLATIFVYLGRFPAVVQALRDELDTVRAAGKLSDPPVWNEVRNLPYLDAVIKEAMRILPVAQWGQDRVVPQGGATVTGIYLPQGTFVGCHADSIHRNQDLYGPDADNFNPSRWTQASEQRRAQMERAMLGFGAGKRMCLGSHIAWLEMKKLIPLLVMKLDIVLLNPDIDLVTEIPPSGVRYLPPLPAEIYERPR